MLVSAAEADRIDASLKCALKLGFFRDIVTLSEVLMDQLSMYTVANTIYSDIRFMLEVSEVH